MSKRKEHTKKKKKRKPRSIVGSGRAEDRKQRRKYAKGGRIEAYTMGDALGKKKDPVWG